MSLRCPRCRVDLVAEVHGDSYYHRCPRCRGLAINNAVLRRVAPPERLKAAWRDLRDDAAGAPCPSCAQPLATTEDRAGSRRGFGACRRCQIVWFEAGALAAFSPQRQEPALAPGALSPEGELALARGVAAARDAREESAQDGLIAGSLLELAVDVLLGVL